jgi:hypothetical protein
MTMPPDDLNTPPADGGTPPPSTDWRESIPEQFREAPFFKDAKTPDEALQHISNAASYMGNSIRIPGPDASDADRQSFYQKLTEKAPGVMPKPDGTNMEQVWNSLGRPSDPKEYRFDPPDGTEIPGDFESFAQVAHKHGLTQDQFKGVLNDIVTQQVTQSETLQAQQNEEMKALSIEWGLAFDNNLSAVKNFLRLTDAPEGIVDLIAEGAMSPAEIKWIHSIATQTKSSTELANQGQGNNSGMLPPAEAKDRIQEILNNQDHPYWRADDPRHHDAVKKMVELHKMANPG